MLYLVRLPSTRKVVCILFDCSPHTKGLVIDSIRPRRDRVLLSCRTPQHKRTRDTELAGHCKESDPRLRRKPKLRNRPRTNANCPFTPRLSSLVAFSPDKDWGPWATRESLLPRCHQAQAGATRVLRQVFASDKELPDYENSLECRTPSTTHTASACGACVHPLPCVRG